MTYIVIGIDGGGSKTHAMVADEQGRTIAEISAKDAQELKDSSRADLKGVKLRLPSKKGDTYDLIESAAASFFKSDERLVSDGEVKIAATAAAAGI